MFGAARGIIKGILLGLDVVHRAPEDQHEEVIPPDEEASYQPIVDEILDHLKEVWKQPPIHRDVHVKAHGLVKAYVEVLDDLDEDLRHGVFAEPGRRYPAWVRFSNGSGKRQPDQTPDGRGMAIKLMGVPGDKLLDEPAGAMTQDLLMIDGPVFFVDEPEHYLAFEEATSDDDQVRYMLNPIQKDRLRRIRQFAQSFLLATHVIDSPLNQRYWSMSPYKLGPHNIKFSARPISSPPVPARPKHEQPDANYLREAMKAQLREGEALFHLEVQRQVPGKPMPLEDPTVEWKEEDSAFVPVARVRILQQDFDTQQRRALSERLSFDPWHGLPAHRPLGGINRLRKRVYVAISRFRRTQNGATLREPTGWEEPPDSAELPEPTKSPEPSEPTEPLDSAEPPDSPKSAEPTEPTEQPKPAEPPEPPEPPEADPSRGPNAVSAADPKT